MPKTLISKKLSHIIAGDFEKAAEDENTIDEALSVPNKIVKKVSDTVKKIVHKDESGNSDSELTWMERRRLRMK